MSRESYNYKRKAVSAAKDLGYSKEIVNLLKKATSEIEIARIMKSAREGVIA
jgi:hypothetical protein